MNILVVDDKQAILTSLDALLTAHGYYVDTACNGLDASEKSQNKIYDLLIIDHLMPIMNGIQLVKKLRQIKEYVATPIIFMTTQGQDSVQAECDSALFSALIDKPINEDELLSLIESHQSSNTRYLSL